jgi:acrosin
MIRHWLRRLARQLQRPAPVRKPPRAKRGPALEHLEDRTTPSTLDFQNGALIYTASPGAASNFTVSIAGSTYTLTDTAETINVTQAAAQAGFSAVGSTATGPDGSSLKAIQVTLGNLNDTANIRSFSKPLSLTTGAGNDTINVSSTGLTGNLNGIGADLTIDAGGGANTLAVSNYTATSGDSNVVIGSSSITGFAGPSGGSAINYTATGGTFSLLRVLGSNTPALAQGFTINNPNATLFQLNANNGTNTINVQAISNAANLVGGLGVDNFVVCSTPDLTGSLDGIQGALSIDGGQGANTLTISDAGTAGPANTALITSTQITGFAGANNDRAISYKAVGGSFGQIHLVGAANPALADQFTVNNPNGPLVLDTGAGDDVVNVQALSKTATINGGTGNDTFNVSSDAPSNLGTLNGINGGLTINAGDGSNVLAVSDYGQTGLTDNVTVTPSAISGFAGSSKGTVINYTGTFSSVILSGSHTNASTFTVSGSTVAVLQGGNGNDTFNLGKGASARSIDGGAGTDTLSYAAYTSAVSVALTGSDGTGFGSTTATGLTAFQGIDNLVGGQGSDSLTGEDVASTWTLGGANSYGDGTATLTFSGFTTLNAGGAGDTFDVQAGASGFALNGGAGTDTLTGVSDVSLSGSGDSNGYGGTADNAITFTGIDVLAGSGTFTGDDNPSKFGIDSTSTYNDGATSNSLSFSGFAAIAGGAGDDVFTIAVAGSATAATLGTLDGGGGTNTLNATNVDAAAQIADGYNYTNFQAVNANGTFYGPNADTTYEWDGTEWLMNGTSIGTPATIQAGTANDTFIVDASTTTTTNLLGGAGDDTFSIGAGASALGAIDGGTGSNTLNVPGSVTLTGSENDAAEVGYAGTSGSLGAGGFVGISVLNDTSATPGALTGESGAHGTWTVGELTSAASSYADNTGTGVGLTFSGFSTLNAGAGDTFNLATDPSTGFTINGGAGTDTLTGVSNATLASSAAAGFSGTADNAISFTAIDVLAGSGSLTNGEGTAGTWTLGAPFTFSDGSQALSFSGFSTLAGSGADTLANVASATLTDSGANGFSGTATAPAVAFTGMTTLAGTGTASLTNGEGTAGTWTLGSPSTFSDGSHTLTLSGFTTLNGSGADTLANVASATLTGSPNGFSGTATAPAVAFTGMTTLTGNGSASLTGEDVSSTWNVSASSSNSSYGDGSHTLTFSGFTTLNAGGAGDTFDVQAGASGYALNGGAGADTLTGVSDAVLSSSDSDGFSGSAESSISFTGIDVLEGTGTLTGENVASTWTLGSANNYSDGTASLTFSGFATVNAGSAGDVFNINGATDVAAANGGAGNDTFNVNASAALNLSGGSGDDTFKLGDGVTLTGSIDGGAGTDTLSYAAYTSAVSVAVTGSDGTGFGSTAASGLTAFQGIDNLVGGQGSDSLTGEDVASTWTLGGANSYGDGSHTLTFSGFESVNAGSAGDVFNINGATDVAAANGGAGNDTFNVNASASLNLNGKAGSDTFNLSDGVTLTGAIDGGSGSDTLSYAASTSPVSVVLSGSSAMTGFSSSNATGLSGFSGIDVLVGGQSGSDSLTGENSVSTWDLDTTQDYRDGTATLTFSAFEHLVGGSAADTFNITSGSTPVTQINGGDGNNIFNVSASATMDLLGGAGNDTFNLGDGVVLTGGIDGGAGTDTVSYAKLTSDVSVVLKSSDPTGYASASATGVTSFKGIDVIVGGKGASDTLTGENVDGTWDLGATQTYDDGAGNGTLAFSGFENLDSGTGNDTFNVTQTTAGVPLTLNAGGGNVTFNVSNLANVLGDFSVNGGTGVSTLNVDDSANTSAVGWVIDATTVQQFGAGAVTYGNIAGGVTVTTGTPTAGGPSNALDVEGVAAGTSLTVQASQTDVTVAQVSGTQAGVQGSLVIDAVGSNVTVTVNDSMNPTDTAYAIDGLTGTISTNTVSISVLEAPTSVSVLGGTGNNTFDVIPSPWYPIYVDGGMGGTNTLIYHHATSTTWYDDGGMIGDASDLVQPVFYFDFTTVKHQS